VSGYCTLPRPKDWPCACRVNIKSYFDRSALECHACGMPVTGEESVRMLFPDAQPARKETFDAAAHRSFMKSLG
jgi:hypothetical protein